MFSLVPFHCRRLWNHKSLQKVDKIINSSCILPNQKINVGFNSVLCHSTFPVLLDKDTTAKTIDQYENILIDCDGVLWSTDHYTKFENISLAIDKLRKMDKKLFFVTNNSMHARHSYITKFTEFAGFEADSKDIFAVSYVAASYIKSVIKSYEKCYIIGNKGMQTELHNVGINTIGYGPDAEEASDHIDDLLNHTIHDDVGAVLVGFDHHFCYNKLFKATSYLSNPNCQYVVTNDREMAVEIGPKHKQPVTGPIVAAVSAASRRTPEVIGKPYHHLLTCLKAENPALRDKKCLMIGDSLRTDIHFAKNCGIDSALVLTGATDIKTVEDAVKNQQHDFIPNFILPRFNDFAKYL